MASVGKEKNAQDHRWHRWETRRASPAAKCNTNPMPDSLLQIDFLPAHYHRKHASKQSQPWRWVVVAAFVPLLAGASLAQWYQQKQLEEQLALLTPQYDEAVEQNKQLAEVTHTLGEARSVAELITYLRHPWPRTQLLKTLVALLPEEVTWSELVIARETPQRNQAPARRGRFRAEKLGQDADLEKLSPAERDLVRFRQQYDELRTVIHMVGTTTDNAALHRYIGQLGRESLFDKAELEMLEAVEGGGENEVRFEATIIVRPGYGQPRGPAAQNRAKLAAAGTPKLDSP